MNINERYSFKWNNDKKYVVPFYGLEFNRLKAAEPPQKRHFTFNHSFMKSPVLIWSTSEGWKVKSTVELLSVFEPETSGLEIHHLIY